jgi:hypothetical protein
MTKTQNSKRNDLEVRCFKFAQKQHHPIQETTELMKIFSTIMRKSL